MSDDKPTQPLTVDPTTEGQAAAVPAEPPQIAGFRPLQMIGEGGFGEVWLAEQLEPVRRQVALKLIKAGMDSKQVLGRFDSERQALALMDHPYIAKVFDAGLTRNGRPYFVMEYIKGVPITQYCDRHRLDTRARLELIRKVCQGVQHAHQKAIIHRDIKPSNVMVTETDGEALPKIIDFGVAKATGQKLTDMTVVTVLDPQRPSTRISKLGPDSHVTANNRRTELPALARLLRGDLDWIVMRALEKERARRYGSPGDLAADIGRFLKDEPVEARPPEQAAADDADMEGGLPPTLNLLAQLQAQRLRYDDAEALLRRSLEIDERLSGPDHPYLVATLNGLANVARDRGRHDEAASDYQRAIRILDGVDAPDIDEFTTVLEDYAACLPLSGEAEQAREVSERARGLARGGR